LPPEAGQKKWEQLLALVTGVLWGLFPLSGLYGFLAAVAVNGGIVLWWTNTQEVDPDDFGGGTVIHNEGVGAAFAVFMLTWIAVFTMAHS